MPVGTVLRAQHVEESFLLSEQFLHKALLIVLDGLEKGGVVAAVLNRPTANLVEFNTDKRPRRCINFGGLPLGSPALPSSAARRRSDRANFTGLVLGCIEAKVCKKICV